METGIRRVADQAVFHGGVFASSIGIAGVLGAEAAVITIRMDGGEDTADQGVTVIQGAGPAIIAEEGSAFRAASLITYIVGGARSSIVTGLGGGGVGAADKGFT